MDTFLSESNVDYCLSIAPGDDPDTYGCMPSSIPTQESSWESESSSPGVVYQQPSHSAQGGPTATSYCGDTNRPSQYLSEAYLFLRSPRTNEGGQGQADGLRWEGLEKTVSWYSALKLSSLWRLHSTPISGSFIYNSPPMGTRRVSSQLKLQ